MWYCIVDTANIPTNSTLLAPPADNDKTALLLTPANGKAICRVGEMIKTACREQFPVNHPEIDYPGCDILVFCSPGVSEVVTKGKKWNGICIGFNLYVVCVYILMVINCMWCMSVCGECVF
jgi:hypothetical protein